MLAGFLLDFQVNSLKCIVTSVSVCLGLLHLGLLVIVMSSFQTSHQEYLDKEDYRSFLYLTSYESLCDDILYLCAFYSVFSDVELHPT